MKSILERTTDDLQRLLPALRALEPEMTQLGEAMMAAWKNRGKVLVAGNGGSAADAMHLDCSRKLIVRDSTHPQTPCSSEPCTAKLVPAWDGSVPE